MTPAPHGSGPEANLRHTSAQMTKNVYSFNSIRSKEKDLFLLFLPSSAIILFLSTLLMGPLCHLLVYSVLSRYPPGSLLLYYLVRNSALCVVCVRPRSGLLYCKKELMCNWRPKVWTSEVAVTSVCYCCGCVQPFTTTENHLQHGWTIGSGRSHYSTSQVSRPYGNSAFAPSHREDKGRLWEKMGVKLPVVEELSVGVRGLFQLLSISRRKI